jgi:hypothetical protein
MRKYDPGAHQFSYGGIPLIGVPDGDYFEAEMNEEGFQLAVGAFGDVAVVFNRNETGLFTARIQASHPTNDLLSAAYHAARAGGQITKKLFGKDGVGTTVVQDQSAIITRIPKITMSKDQPVREWILACPRLFLFAGGGEEA